jgi:plastocyanin
VLVLLGVAGVVLVIATSSSSSNHSTSAARATNTPIPARSAAFNPASVTVAVLNGTATNQLAHRVATKLQGSGYREGRIATAANQTETTTVVAYLPGAKNRTDALHVARALNLRPSAVRPIDQDSQQVACPPPGSCDANVVVTVGADLATL